LGALLRDMVGGTLLLLTQRFIFEKRRRRGLDSSCLTLLAFILASPTPLLTLPTRLQWRFYLQPGRFSEFRSAL
jgi:hypothetical protein